MADEVLGNIYEVLTIVAIEDYTTILKKGETVFWHEHPKGVLIEPDLTIGKDKDQPRLLFQISHTNAESASHHKFWRNIGEFVDARLALGSSTSIVNIVFDSLQKRGLADATEALFDGFLEADRTPYGGDLLQLARKIVKKVVGTVQVDDRAKLIRGILAGNPSDAQVMQLFANDLSGVVATSSSHSGNWYSAFAASNKTRITKRVPSIKRTAVRRGLGRLLPISTEVALRDLIDKAKRRVAATVPGYFKTLGLSRPSIKGTMVSDEEILSLVDTLAEDAIVKIWKAARTSTDALRQACRSVEVANEFPLFHSFVASSLDKLCKSKQLEVALSDCFNDPDSVLGVTLGLSSPSESGVWLFDYLMTVIKAHSGKQQGYGYTPLDAEAGTNLGTGIGPHLSLFISREKNLRSDILSGFSTAIAARLAKIGKAWVAGNSAKVSEYYLRAMFEDKIYKSSKLNPLKSLLAFHPGLKGISFDSRAETYLTAFAGSGKATTEVARIKNTLIIWQSASDSGVGHKMKEQCGRIGMLRVTRSNKGIAIPAPTIKKAIFLIDGTWTAEHIQRLVDSGFDEVYYPDEIDQLVAAIV